MEAARKELHPDQLEFDLDSLGASASVSPAVQSQRSALLWDVMRNAYTILGLDR